MNTSAIRKLFLRKPERSSVHSNRIPEF